MSAWQLLAFNNQLRWFGKHPTTRRLGGGILTSPAALDRLLANLPDWNLYAHVNPIAPDANTGIKASSSQVSHWRFVVIDIDPIEGLNASPLKAAYDLAADLPDPTVLDTGRGAQLWLELLTPMRLNGVAHRLEVERGMSGFLRHMHHRMNPEYGCLVDTSCSDLARVVRLPGSTNQKTLRPCQLLDIGAPCDIAEIVLAHAIAPPEPATGRRVDSSNLAGVLPHLTNVAQRFLTEGTEQGNRHSAAYATACSLREVGVPLNKALNWVCRGGSLCSPPLNTQADETELERAVVRAYTKP